jgi:hypothetical protein
MPMTGQNAVLDAAALEWKAHVRATVVEREGATAVVHDEDRTMATVHNEPALRLQLLKGPRSAYSLLGASMFLWAGCRRADT